MKDATTEKSDGFHQRLYPRSPQRQRGAAPHSALFRVRRCWAGAIPLFCDVKRHESRMCVSVVLNTERQPSLWVILGCVQPVGVVSTRRDASLVPATRYSSLTRRASICMRFAAAPQSGRPAHPNRQSCARQPTSSCAAAARAELRRPNRRRVIRGNEA